jgi:hypothetical protein
LALQIDSLRPFLPQTTAVQQQTTLRDAENDTPECFVKLQDLLAYDSGLTPDNTIKETYCVYRHPEPPKFDPDILNTAQLTQLSIESRHNCDKHNYEPFTEIQFLAIEDRLKTGDIELLEVVLLVIYIDLTR